MNDSIVLKDEVTKWNTNNRTTHTLSVNKYSEEKHRC